MLPSKRVLWILFVIASAGLFGLFTTTAHFLAFKMDFFAEGGCNSATIVQYWRVLREIPGDIVFWHLIL